MKLSDDWISVEDQMPPKNERVFVWLWEKGKVDIDIILQQGSLDGGRLRFAGNYRHRVSLWQPLPAPPKE